MSIFLFLILKISLLSKTLEKKLEKYIKNNNYFKLAKFYHFLKEDSISDTYLNISKESVEKAKLYFIKGDKEKGIQALVNYIKLDKNILDNIDELEILLKLLHCDEDIKKIFKIAYQSNEEEVLKLLSKSRYLKFIDYKFLLQNGKNDYLKQYFFNKIETFYDFKNYADYFKFLEEVDELKFNTYLEEIIYHRYKNQLFEANELFEQEIKKTNTNLEIYMLHKVMDIKLRKDFEFPSEELMYRYIKDLNTSDECYDYFVNSFLEKYPESIYSNDFKNSILNDFEDNYTLEDKHQKIKKIDIKYNEAFLKFEQENYLECLELLKKNLEYNILQYNMIKLCLRCLEKLNMKEEYTTFKDENKRIIQWYEI